MRKSVELVDSRLARLRAMQKRLRAERRLAVLCEQQRRLRTGKGQDAQGVHCERV